jgi:hypothetical protein
VTEELVAAIANGPASRRGTAQLSLPLAERMAWLYAVNLKRLTVSV